MLPPRAVIAVLLGWMLLTDIAAAEPAERVPRPGVEFRGRTFGFRPRHGQQRAAPTKATSNAHRTPRRPAARELIEENSAVTASAFEQTALTEDVPRIVEEGADDTDVMGPEFELWHDDPGTNLCMDPVCPIAPRFWVRGDYLHWWTKGMGVPALATTSPSGTPQEDAGVLGSINTTVLFGDGDLLDESRSGGRITLGMWLNTCHDVGLELSYLGLDTESEVFRASSDQFAILARPFFNVVTAAQDSRLIAYPDLVEGQLTATVETEFKSADVLLRRRGVPACWSSVEYFYGYRYAEILDGVFVNESTVSLADPTTGTSFELDDIFETRNRFHGGQIGTRIVARTSPCWSLEFVGKVALGNTNSRTTITGETIVTTPDGDVATQPSGLLVQESNRGVYDTNEISTISEIGLTLSRDLYAGWSLSFGYSFLFWTDVLRAGEQIDTSINSSQIPPGQLDGEARPAFRAVTNDFWAQGLNLGLDFRY